MKQFMYLFSEMLAFMLYVNKPFSSEFPIPGIDPFNLLIMGTSVQHDMIVLYRFKQHDLQASYTIPVFYCRKNNLLNNVMNIGGMERRDEINFIMRQDT